MFIVFDNLAQYKFSIQSPCSYLSLWLPLGVRSWFHIEIQNEKGIDLLVQCGILFLNKKRSNMYFHPYTYDPVTLLFLSSRLEMYFFKPWNLSCAMWLSLASGIFKNEMQTKTSKTFAHWNLSSFALHPPGTTWTNLDGCTAGWEISIPIIPGVEQQDVWASLIPDHQLNHGQF